MFNESRGKYIDDMSIEMYDNILVRNICSECGRVKHYQGNEKKRNQTLG